MARESIRAKLHRTQGGLCWHCGTPLPQRGSHRHHRVAGDPGSIVLVHGRCHNKLHPHSSRKTPKPKRKTVRRRTTARRVQR